MSSDEGEEEFLEDFAAPAFSEEDLERILHRARGSGNAELRGLVKTLQALRYISRVLLERVEAQSPGEDTPGLKLARFLIRGEGGIGNDRA